jgi:hypothetical protein
MTQTYSMSDQGLQGIEDGIDRGLSLSFPTGTSAIKGSIIVLSPRMCVGRRRSVRQARSQLSQDIFGRPHRSALRNLEDSRLRSAASLM